MNNHYSKIPRLVLLENNEQELRVEKIRQVMKENDLHYALISGNSNKYYLTGRVFAGFIFIEPHKLTYYVKRPVELEGDNIIYIRKPEDIDIHVSKIGLELGDISYLGATRLIKIFQGAQYENISAIIAEARSVKTECEIEKLKESGQRQDAVYRLIPGLYKPGMTDIEFQIEIERLSRLHGCLGQFRIAGDSMELFMGNVLAGDNADAPSPYDFAMGGAGMDPSIPVGADGTIIEKGMTVMVDVNGNYTGYMTDMTRCYHAGNIDDLAWEAHRCSVDIHRMAQQEARPGTKASLVYEAAMEIVKERHLEKYFMGHRQHAGFIGHGVGIEINELPVIAPRSRDVIRENNVIALEPKFVIPRTGAVGIENTYIVRPHALECITNCNEDLIDLF